MLKVVIMNSRINQGGDGVYTAIALVLVILASVSVGLFIDVLWESQHTADDVGSVVLYTSVMACVIFVLGLFFNEKHRQNSHKRMVRIIDDTVSGMSLPAFEVPVSLRVLDVNCQGIVIDNDNTIAFHKASVNVAGVTLSQDLAVLVGIQWGQAVIYYAPVADKTAEYQWSQADTTGFTKGVKLRCIAHNDNCYVAAGKQGGHGVIYTSPNGKNWTEVVDPITASVYSFWSIKQEDGVFTVRGNDMQDCKDVTFSSSDGLSWVKN